MSVINQMLHDLESRRSQLNSTTNTYQHLSFIPKLTKLNKFENGFYLVFLSVLITTAILVFVKVAGNNSISTLAEDDISTTQTYDKYSPVILESITPITPIILVPESNRKITSIKKSVLQSSGGKSKTIDKQSFTKVAVSNSITKQPLTSKIEYSDNNYKDGQVHKRQRELTAAQKAEQFYQSGYASLLAKNNFKAQEQLRNALMFLPSHNRSRELLAGIYIKNGRIVEARTLLQYGMRISPRHSIFAKLYARLLMDQGDTVTAISVLLRNPPSITKDTDYHALLAVLYQKNKQHRESAKLYSQLLTLRKNYGIWWLGMAISLEALGNDSQAKLAFEKAKNSGNLSKGLYQYTNQRVTALEEIAYP